MLRADYSRVDAHVLRVLYGGPATACSGPPGTDAAPPFETHLTAYGHCDAAAAHEPCGRSVGTPAVSSDDDVVPSERRRAGVALAIFGPLVGAAVASKPRDAARHRRSEAAATTPNAATTADPSEETASAAAAGGEQRQRRRVRPSAEKRRRLKGRAVLEAASGDGDVHS
jgi:hypothetical protein